MNLPDIPLFAALNERMKWLTARQEMLSRNIAHSDMPEYEALDIKELDFAALVRKADRAIPLKTDPHHLQGTLPVLDAALMKSKTPYETAPSGNSVVLEEQMTKMADTQARYSLMVNLYRKQVDLLKLAIGRTSP